MPKNYRKSPIPPLAILTQLADAHVYLSETNSDDTVAVPLHLFALATFCSLAWGLENWKDASREAQERPLPKMRQDKVERLWRKHQRDMEGEADGDEMEMWAVWRQLGNEYVVEAVEALKGVDEELAEVLGELT